MSRYALALAGLLFFLYPALRPWTDETTSAGAREAMGSSAWVVSHFLAVVGFILVPLALWRLVSPRPVAVMGVGAGLTLPYYGAEDFGLHGAATTSGTDLLAVADAVRFNPLAVTCFGVGLVLLAVGAVLVAVEGWGRGKYAAVLFAAGFVLFLPQFFTPAPVRIAHGLLMAVGLVWFAIACVEREPVRPAARLTSQGAA